MSASKNAADIWDADDAEPVTPPTQRVPLEGPTVEDLEALAEPCEGQCYRCGRKGLVWQRGADWTCDLCLSREPKGSA